MKSTDTTKEIAVLERAKHTFHNNGLGDRMWADPGATDGSPLSGVFFLSEEQRTEFIASARAEIEIESRSSLKPSTTISRMKGET